MLNKKPARFAEAGLLGARGLQTPYTMSTSAHKKPVEAPAAAPAAVKAATSHAEGTALTFLRAHPAYGYWPGEAASLPDEVAAALIADKYAEAAK